MEIRRRILGEDHADTASSYNSVGCTYKTLGNYKEALNYKTKSLEIRRRILGEDHANTVSSYNNVGYTYKSLGNYKEALNY